MTFLRCAKIIIDEVEKKREVKTKFFYEYKRRNIEKQTYFLCYVYAKRKYFT